MATIISTKTSGVGGLSVTGDASGILQLASADGTTALTIDGSQNVGIGTSSPAYKLDVSTASGNAYISVARNALASGQVGLQINGGTSGTIWYLFNATSSNDLSFFGNGAERMRIDSSGNVGIGTSSPSTSFYKLTVAGDVGAGAGISIRSDSSTSAISRISFTRDGTDGTTGLIRVANSDYSMQFWTANGTNNTERMRIDSSGNLLVGTTSNTVNNSNSFVYRQDLGAEILNHISGTVTGSQYIYFGYNGSVIGSVTQNLTTGVLYNVSSDQRLKTNIQPAGSAIQSILDFPVDQFDWISDSSHQDFGGVAQKILKVIPEMVSVPENPEEMMGLDWSKAVPRLIKTIQELKAIIDTQTARIEALEAKI